MKTVAISNLAQTVISQYEKSNGNIDRFSNGYELVANVSYRIIVLANSKM